MSIGDVEETVAEHRLATGAADLDERLPAALAGLGSPDLGPALRTSLSGGQAACVGPGRQRHGHGPREYDHRHRALVGWGNFVPATLTDLTGSSVTLMHADAGANPRSSAPGVLGPGC